jgi:Phosphotransferase enzyme family
VDTTNVDTLFQRLAGAAEVAVASREPIRVWARSGVERLRLADGRSVIFKYAEAPFDTEDSVLAALAGRGLPVPALIEAAHREDVLGMLIEDLGPAERDADEDDGIAAAVVLHAAGEVAELPRLDQTILAGLPNRALATATRHWPEAAEIHHMLECLSKLADFRAVGTQFAPFGACHSEFHPSSVHIGAGGRLTMLDFARAFSGPGVLDLASWPGTIEAPDPGRVEDLLHRYVAAGGDSGALAERGGLPAARWALGWHRVWIVDWFIDRAPQWATDAATDQAWREVIRRHLSDAVALLGS